MKKTQVYLPEKQYHWLKLESRKENKPYAAIVRDAVEQYIEKKREKTNKAFSWRQHAKKYAVKMGGIASKIDQELYQ